MIEGGIGMKEKRVSDLRDWGGIPADIIPGCREVVDGTKKGMMSSQLRVLQDIALWHGSGIRLNTAHSSVNGGHELDNRCVKNLSDYCHWTAHSP